MSHHITQFGPLPKLTTEPVPTPWFTIGQFHGEVAIRSGGIVTFDGASGTGKTTTATVAASNSPLRFVYTKLRHGARTRETAEALYQALHPGRPLPPRVNERTLIAECTEALSTGTVGVIADEVHRIGIPGMLLLANIWDTVLQRNGHGFPLFLVGCDLNAAIASAPALDTRIYLRTQFGTLDFDEILPVITGLNARCAATPPARLNTLDRLWAKGNLRRWTFHFFNYLDQTGPQGDTGQPVSANEVKEFLLRQGVTLKDAKVA